MIEEWVDYKFEEQKFLIQQYIDARNNYLYLKKKIIQLYTTSDFKSDDEYNTKLSFNCCDNLPDEKDILFWTEDTGAFRASKSDVISAILHTNRNLYLRGESSLYEFYSFIGVKKFNVNSQAENWGWTTEYVGECGCEFLDIYPTRHDRLFNEPVYSFEYDLEPIAIPDW